MKKIDIPVHAKSTEAENGGLVVGRGVCAGVGVGVGGIFYNGRLKQCFGHIRNNHLSIELYMYAPYRHVKAS